MRLISKITKNWLSNRSTMKWDGFQNVAYQNIRPLRGRPLSFIVHSTNIRLLTESCSVENPNPDRDLILVEKSGVKLKRPRRGRMFETSATFWNTPMKWLLIMLLAVNWHLASSQNITVVEYFFDTDPGYGSGTSVAITPSPTITNFNFNINVTSAADGFHTLFVRAKDANNNWSAAYSRPFYKLSASVVSPTAPNINKIEYFFDTDPGYGAGTDVPITPAVAITDQNFAIPLSSAADGFHTLYVRTRDANNNWSAAYSRPFYKLSSSVIAPVPNINKLEYFIDADPGYGAGVNVPITTGVAVTDLVVPIAVTAITEGTHIITFRARDANNNWSVVAIKAFSKCNHPGTTANAAASITSSGFTASWADVPGSISYQLDVSADNFNTFVSGYNSKVITAPALSTAVTGLSQATAYKYRVRAVAGCASVESNAISLTTLATPPAAQPTNLLFSSITSSSFTAFFTAPSTVPTGYLVIRKIGSASAFVPTNNTSYTLNQNTGDGIVAYIGSSFLFNESGLTPDTHYFYSVFAYNQVSTSISYLTTSPLQNNVRTVALEPTAQPTNLQFATVTDVGFTVSYTAATGSPTGYLVLRKTGSAPTATPVDGTTYTTTVGTDAVVYNGPTVSFSQSGLTQNTEYFYAVYAYNGSGTAINYLTVAPLQGSQLTPITPPSASPTNLVFSNVAPTTMTVAYTAASGSPSGYLVIRKVGVSPSFVPQTNVAYTTGQILSDGEVAYVGSALTFNESGLAPSTTYFYDVYAYNQISALIGYRTSSPLEGSKSTFTAEPSAQASALIFTSTTTNAHTVSFTAASPAPTGYLALRKTGSAATSLPIDGTAYALGETIGDGTVAFVGAANTFTDNGLQPGITYFYQIFSYNGSSAATNYLTTLSASNAGSKITVPDKPVLAAATSIQQNQFTVNWTAVTGAANYRLDVSKDNFVTKVSGFDDATVNGTSSVVNGLETGTAYKYRLRAVNASGTSLNSDEAQQFTIPATPVLAASTSVGQTGFTANWTSIIGAMGYFMDVSLANNFATFVNGYQNKSLSNVTSESISGLTSGTVYYFRIRSTNSGGTSPSSTIVGSQLLIPATPVGLDATNTTSSSFKAKWQAVSGITEYRLDVTLSADNFNPSLTAYTDKLISSSLTEELVLGLAPNTAYKYRVRAVNASGVSPSSVPIAVSTLETSSGIPLELSNLTFPSTLASNPINATVEVKGGTPPYAVTFNHRKIAGSAYSSSVITSTGIIYSTSINASMLDELGIEFFFKVVDVNGTSVETTKRFIYKAIPAEGILIPLTKFGGTDESYTIFSIPYKLNDTQISSLFDPVLGGYNKKKWRLVRYQNGDNVDYENGINKIEQGKGYWFNSKEKVEINFKGGITAEANSGTPFVMSLEKGWNQIGNPFPFNVDWDDVKAANPSVANQLGENHIFNATDLHLLDKSNTLVPFSGGFVLSESATTINFPVSLKATAGGRKSNAADENNVIDENNWTVPFDIRLGNLEARVAAIGMNESANLSKDKFDGIVPPRFLNYVEFYSNHDEYFLPQFSKDIVPTANMFTWDFVLETNVAANKAELTWPSQSLGNGEAQLLLVDVSNNEWISMKNKGSYPFEVHKDHRFKIVYAKGKDHLDPSITLLGNPHPNPFSKQTVIPFIVREDQSRVKITVLDMMGRTVAVPVQGVFSSGLHETTWDGTSLDGEILPSGMYICQMEANGFLRTVRIIKQ
jgi:FlgD Ig-like domain